MEQGSDGLSDLVYNALHGEISWQQFLDEVRRIAPNGQGFLFYHDANAGAGAFPLSAGIDAEYNAAYTAYYSRLNPWMPHAAMRPLGRVVQADSMLRRADLVATEFYNDYLEPQDIHTGFGVTIERDGGLNFLFSVLCADTDDLDTRTAMEKLQALVPHLQQAFARYRRSGVGGMAIADPSDSAPYSGVAGVVRIGSDLRVLAADAAALGLAESCSQLSIRPFGRFACASEAITGHVARVLAAWAGHATAPEARSFHLFRGDGELPLRVTAFRPCDAGGIAYFRGPECVLVIEDPAIGIEPAVDEFGTRFGLTRAERRLVAALAAGLAIEQIAAANGTSRNTVKTQLKQIFAKTSLGRQTDLVRHVCVMAGAYRSRVLPQPVAPAPEANGAKRPS